MGDTHSHFIPPTLEMQQNHAQHLPIKHVCGLSRLTSVPYKQLWSSKTIIIHCFHPNGQQQSSLLHSTPVTPRSTEGAGFARSWLTSHVHSCLLLDVFICPNKRNQNQSLGTLRRKCPAWAGENTQRENKFCFFRNRAILHTKPAFHFTDFSSSSNQKSKKQMLTLKCRVTDTLR